MKTKEQILSFLMNKNDSSSSEPPSTSSIKPKRTRPRVRLQETGFSINFVFRTIHSFRQIHSSSILNMKNPILQSKAGALGLGEEVTESEIDPGSPLPQIKTIRVSKDEKSPRAPKSRLGNVWNRLTSSKESKTTTGKILPFCSSESDPDENRGLTCHKVMVGHSKPIVTLYASEDGQYLISSSKDKTVKVWDLVASKELGSIVLNSAISVIEYSKNLLYLAEGNKLQIYDISISFDTALKSLQEVKNINFMKIDNQNRLYTVQEKTVIFQIFRHSF